MEGGDSFTPLSTAEAAPGALSPGLGLPVQERYKQAGNNSVKGHQDDEGTGASLL